MIARLNKTLFAAALSALGKGVSRLYFAGGDAFAFCQGAQSLLDIYHLWANLPLRDGAKPFMHICAQAKGVPRGFDKYMMEASHDACILLSASIHSLIRAWCVAQVQEVGGRLQQPTNADGLFPCGRVPAHSCSLTDSLIYLMT